MTYLAEKARKSEAAQFENSPRYATTSRSVAEDTSIVLKDIRCPVGTPSDKLIKQESTTLRIGLERPLITIEFAPDLHPTETEYSYSHPLFTFGDRVIYKNEYPEIKYTVCALELIESKTLSGKLLASPRWKYKITNEQVSYWKDESALARYEERLFDQINEGRRRKAEGRSSLVCKKF